MILSKAEPMIICISLLKLSFLRKKKREGTRAEITSLTVI